MISKKIWLAAAMSSAFALVAPAHAQGLNVDAGVDVDVDVGVEAGGSEEDNNAEAGAEGNAAVGVMLGGEGGGTVITTDGDADAQVDLVIGLIVNSEWQGNEFNGEISVNGAQAYSVAAWLRDETEARFRAAVAESQDQIQRLRAAIAANAMLTAWLQAQGHEVSTVVAAGVDAEGRLVAFTE